MVDANKNQFNAAVPGQQVTAEMLESRRTLSYTGSEVNPDEEVDYRTRAQKVSDGYKYALPNSIIGGIAEVTESLPLLNRKDADAVVEFLTNKPMLKDFKASQEAYRTSGALGFSLIPILGVQKLMKAKSFADKVEKVLGKRISGVILPSKISTEDRIEQVRNLQSAYIRKQGISITAETTPEIVAAMKQAGRSEFLDMVKIGVATDLGIFTVLSANEFFFPEDMSAAQTVAMYGVPNLVFSGVVGAMMKHKLRNTVTELGAVSAEARNKMGLSAKDALSQPGQRDTYATILQAKILNKNKELAEAGNDSTLITNINTQIQALNVELYKQLDLIAKDNPYPGITSKYELSQGEHNTLKAGGDQDYTLNFNVVSFEQASKKNLGEMPKILIKQKEDLTKEIAEDVKKLGTMEQGVKASTDLGFEIQTKRELLKDLERSTVVRIDVDGSMALASDIKEGFNEISTGVVRNIVAGADGGEGAFNKSKVGDLLKIQDKVTGDVSYSTKVLEKGKEQQILIDDKFNIIAPFWKEDYQGLSYKTKTSIQATMRKAVDDFDLAADTVKPIIINNKMSHVEMDAVLELAAKHGQDHPTMQATVKFDSEEISGWAELEFASLNKKYTEWTQGVEQIGKQAESILKLGKGQTKTLDDLIVELNLPNNGVGGMHPLMQVFSDLHITGAKNLNEVFPTIESLKKAVQKTVLPQGDLIGKYIETPKMNLHGTQLKTYAEERTPVLAVIKDSGINPLKREELLLAATRQRMKMIDGLMDSVNKGAPIITAIAAEGMRDVQRLKTASSVHTIVDGGEAHSSRIWSAMGGLENQPAHVAVDSMANAWDNFTNAYIAKKFEPHNEDFQRLISSLNEGELNFFNFAVHQQGLGWRGLAELEEVIEGGVLKGYKIPLEDHAVNKKMLEDTYGIVRGEDEGLGYMPAPKFKQDTPFTDLVIPPLAAKSMMAINEMSQDVLTHWNQLRELSNLAPIPRKALHMIPKNMSDKEKIWLINRDTGEVGTIATGNTAVQARTAAKGEIEAAQKQGVTLFEATESDLQNFNIIKGSEFSLMTDFSTSFRQKGAGYGATFGHKIEVGPEVLRRQQEVLINQYKTIAQTSAMKFLEPEIRAAEMAAKSSGLALSAKNVAAKTRLDKGQDMWNAWIRRALSKKSGDEKQTIGKFYNSVEDVYDTILQKAWDEKVIALKGGQTAGQAERAFAGLEKAGAGFNPVMDSLEFLENTMRIKSPHNIKKHSGKLAAYAGATLLRMGNLSLAFINIATLPTLIPIVQNAMKRLPDESMEAWKARNFAWSSTLDDTTAIWNPGKATISTAHFFFSKEGRAVIKEAGEKGHLWQKTVEQMQLFTSPSKGYNERMLTKAVDAISIATDKTEEWSRGLSYAMFYKMGRDNIKLNHDTAMEFAHNMANTVIGDFRPNNRPQIFQGPVGAQFGLFMTFAQNYMQRVFGYLEKGQFDSFFKQMGLQASVFGAKSLPGFNQYVENFTSNYDGTENMVDRLTKIYPQETIDAILYGAAGASTGTAFHTRVDIRLPGSNFARNYEVADMMPAIGSVKRLYTGMSELVQNLQANQGLNRHQAMETVARNFPISGLRGILEVSNGQTVDARGQIVNEHLKSGVNIMRKVGGFKSIREQGLIDEMARIRSTSLKHKEARKQFNMMIRSGFRAGEIDMNAAAIQFGKATGGEYSGFKRAVQNQMEAALVNKGYSHMLNTSINQSNIDGMMRMINVLGNEDYE